MSEHMSTKEIFDAAEIHLKKKKASDVMNKAANEAIDYLLKDAVEDGDPIKLIHISILQAYIKTTQDYESFIDDAFDEFIRQEENELLKEGE